VKKTLAALALALALVSSPASAYYLTCGAYKAAILSNVESVQFAAVGHSFGTVDMLATLLCFGRDRRCNCLSNLDSRTDGAFANALAARIAACPDNNTAVGPAFNAALDVCR